MACIQQPECYFLHGFFRCHQPVATVDVGVRITSMQGTHTFRRERTCQIIRFNPCSTRLHPHPTIIKKMKTFLELEGMLGPKLQLQADQSRPTQPNTNPHVRKETEKRKQLIPTKKYKVKVMARPKPKTSKATMQPPVTMPDAPTNLESQKPLQGSSSESNPHHSKIFQLELAPHDLKQERSQNIFELRKDWPIPPTPTTSITSKPPIK